LEPDDKRVFASEELRGVLVVLVPVATAKRLVELEVGCTLERLVRPLAVGVRDELVLAGTASDRRPPDSDAEEGCDDGWECVVWSRDFDSWWSMSEMVETSVANGDIGTGVEVPDIEDRGG